MDFAYSEEQQMLADLVGRFVERGYGFDRRRALAAGGRGFSEDNWQQFAQMGLLGLNVPAEYGGLGATAVETLIVMEAFGRGLVLEPFVSSAVIGAWLIAAAGSEQHRRELLASMADGRRRFALASLEAEGRSDLWHVGTVARATPGGWTLSGHKAVVVDGDSADLFLVSARTSGNTSDRDGISLFLVPAGAPGVTVRGFPCIDGKRAAEVLLKEVTVPAADMLGGPGHAYAAIEGAVDRGIAALCAEAVGAMARLVDLTAEHLRTRKQFGKPIGTFQALQHRAVDMLVALEQARSLAFAAAAGVDSSDAAERRRMVSAAKAMIGISGRAIGQAAVQLHGGMGMTDELPVGHYFKRLTCIDLCWGGSEHHVELYGDHLATET
jgi:alkylation response protein AidB-like acyl-CoA dehydrogenase